jgi:hypothetical protein
MVGKEDKRRKRSATENNSRQRSENLQLNDTAIEWGNYDIHFPTSGSAGELELYDFIQQLEKSSGFATTRADITARLLWSLRKSSKLDLLTQLKAELLNLPQDDFILLTDMRSLRDALNRPFQIPLLHRMTTNYPSLTSCTNFGIREVLNHLALDQMPQFQCTTIPLKIRLKEQVRQQFVSFFHSFGKILFVALRSTSLISRTAQEFNSVLIRSNFRISSRNSTVGKNMIKVKPGRNGRQNHKGSFSSYHRSTQYLRSTSIQAARPHGF